MAFINKIFSIKKKTQKNNENAGWNGFQFNEQQIRVILFRECDLQNRKLLFDSAAIKKLSLDTFTTNSMTLNTVDTNLNSSPNSRNNSMNSLQDSLSSRIRKISTDSAHEKTNIQLLNEEQQSTNLNRKNSLNNLTIKNSENSSQLKPNTIIEYSNGCGYQFSRPSGDINALGEMIFGSVALTFRGTCLKIHSHRTNKESAKNLMCSHVFYPPIRPVQRPSVTGNNVSMAFSSKSDVSSTDSSLKHDVKTKPLDVPRRDNEEDSGLGEHSASSSVSSYGFPSFNNFDTNLQEQQSIYQNNSNNSLNRRTFRNLMTSLDYWPNNSQQMSGSFSIFVGGSTSSYTTHSGSFNENNNHHSNSTNDFCRRNSSSTEESFNINSTSKKIKLGLAVIIDLTIDQESELELYLLEHMPILDMIIWRLRDCVHRAYWRKSAFVPIMLDGSKEAAQSIRHLLCSSQNNYLPIWCPETVSDLSSNESISSLDESNKSDPFWKLLFKNDFSNEKRNETEIDKFVRDFCELLKIMDNKNTNFFLSALITAILSYHLGWILSVSDKTETQNPVCCALWTQLTEMCGAIGNPPKYAQTVVVGKSISTNNILQILTYFIRFSTVTRKHESLVENVQENEMLNNISQFLTTNTQRESNIVQPLTKPSTLVIKEDSNDSYEMKNFDCSKKNHLSSYIVNDKSLIFNDNEKSHTNKFSNDLKSLCLFEKNDKCEHKNETLNEKSNVDCNKLGNIKRTKTHTKMLDFDNKDSLTVCDSVTDVSKIDYHKVTECILENFSVRADKSQNLNKLCDIADNFNEKDRQKEVVFVLGENEKLVDIKPKSSCDTNSTSQISNFRKDINSSFSNENIPEHISGEHKFKRSQSVPPLPSSSTIDDKVSSSKCPPRSPCHQRLKKYSGVKFNFEQYPQIATNYMKSKNIEIANIPFLEKGLQMSDKFTMNFSTCNFPKNQNDCQCGYDECSDMILQTPSNASELESTSDLPQKKFEHAQVNIHLEKDILEQQFVFERKKLNSTIVINESNDLKNVKFNEQSKNNFTSNKNFKCIKKSKSIKTVMKIEHPLEQTKEDDEENENLKYEKIKYKKLKMVPLPVLDSFETFTSSLLPPPGYKSSLMRIGQVYDQYMPGAILQGITEPISNWSCALKRDLALIIRHSPIDQPISEAVCILADVDTWSVQVISSHSLTISGLTGLPQIQNSNLSGIPISASQLVGDMLESFQELWKSRVSSHFCLQHIEEKLREIYIKSFAFSELLLATDFCDMGYLTSTLELHPNDVPLLLAVASTHTPQLAQKYNVTFQ